MAFLRFSEFHKMEVGKITEPYVYLGLAELIIALSLWLLTVSNGYEALITGIASHDGLIIENSRTDTSTGSADLVENML